MFYSISFTKKLYVLLYCIDTLFILYSYEGSTNFYIFAPISQVSGEM